MKTKEELKEELEKDAEVLRKYFKNVTLLGSVADGQFFVVVEDYASIPNRVFKREYKTIPPAGNLCLCWHIISLTSNA